MKLSYTGLKAFQQCHFRYHLRYNRGLPSRPRPAAQSSKALHGTLHLFHQGLKQQQTNASAQGKRTLILLKEHLGKVGIIPTRFEPFDLDAAAGGLLLSEQA